MSEVAASAPVAESGDGGSSTDGMIGQLMAAADAVAAKGLAMSIAGYDAQAASKHP
ncbi:MAG: hypothetical protein KJ798_05065 [Gammaproteobacteria bacterium]|uniref:hypothetical protein n=1 Tax=Limnobacter sp. TaxID=2003368 RepID=UPI001DFE177A|nr:hypothetical protein [Limnobacter sp.]MBU0784080.1 hypothetical protein [Gammaproteobacteria bacterium]MDZ4296924.1 hypothetical protein [Moraxellaceae bacterium]MBU0849818.1 hypothetical protein [Gammaproteobacteria bacterium]MBU1266896.1 hypothetical protein [Gammaproteobacteria bacterium]MBU1779736.1 hypothetical protein [Gammaproteobacteria bacterium]